MFLHAVQKKAEKEKGKKNVVHLMRARVLCTDVRL